MFERIINETKRDENGRYQIKHSLKNDFRFCQIVLPFVKPSWKQTKNFEKYPLLFKAYDKIFQEQK